MIREAEKLLKETEELPSPSKLLAESRTSFEQKISNIYNWQTNTDNNARSMRKELQGGREQGERNLLGLQKSSTFLEAFSLSELMSLDLLRMKSKLNTDTYYLLSAPKIVELVLFAAVCYFTIATERRFSAGNLDVGSLKIS